MAKRTPEEILAQRDAWLARKAAREAGEDVPRQPPLKAGEVAPEPTPAQVSAEPTPTPESAPEPVPAEPEVVAAPVVATAEAAAPAPKKVRPQAPAQKRTPEEIRAQREAWLARKTAREAGAEVPAPAPPAPAPAAEKPPVATAKPAAAKPPVATAKPAAAPKPARAAAAPAAPVVDPNLTRRELLNYAWLASIALFSVETIGLSLWFAFPNFKEGQFGGLFPIGVAREVVPEANAGPIPFVDGKFWLVNVDTEFNGEIRKGVLAIYKVCTHLGCLYEWVPMTGRFECPCHGSKFALSGDYLAGPARRSLDLFVIQVIGPDGAVKAETDLDGNPLVVSEDDQLAVDTGQRILGSADIIPA